MIINKSETLNDLLKGKTIEYVETGGAELICCFDENNNYTTKLADRTAKIKFTDGTDFVIMKGE